jgi:hypothetical protein
LTSSISTSRAIPRPRDGSRISGCARRGPASTALQGLFGGAFAPESWVLSQSYYYGAVGGIARAEVIDGTTIDRADELDEIAVGKQSRRNGLNGDARGTPDPEAPIVDIIAALAILHPAKAAVAGSVPAFGRVAAGGAQSRDGSANLHAT